MTKKRMRVLLCTAAVLAALTAIGFSASGGAGSQSDPLVTLSYLTETFTGQVMEKVDALIAQRNDQLSQSLGGGASVSGGAYAAVTLSAGQALYGEAGCEVLLRSGGAACAPSAEPGLIDATSGGSVSGGGALQPNHLYLMTDSRTVTSASGASLLVRGPYAVR